MVPPKYKWVTCKFINIIKSAGVKEAISHNIFIGAIYNDAKAS